MGKKTCAFSDCDAAPVDGLLCDEHRLENKIADMPSEVQEQVDAEREGRPW